MSNPFRHLLPVAIALTLVLAGSARADTLAVVTSPSGQAATDSLNWSQLGGDGTVLGTSFTGKTALGSSVMVGLAGANSIISVVCLASPCSWTGMGLNAGHSLLWTSDALNGGNGPVTLTLAKPVAGLGAFLQADLPAAFTAKIQVFNGATSLGSFTVASSTGVATYIGVLDKTGANITSAVFSLTSCATICTDFALDSVAITAPVAVATAATLAASVNPSVFGQAVVFTATVSPNTATGTVTFKDGAVGLGTSTLVSGKASLTSTSLAPGSHSITATYSGSTAFLSSTSAALPHTVNKASTKASVVSSHNPSVFGQSVTFAVTVSAVAPGSGTPTGTVTLKNGTAALGTVTLSGGKATFSTSALTPGTHLITVSYNGNVDFSSSTSAALGQTVNKASTKTTVVSSHNPSVFGQSVTFTATLAAVAPGSGTPTGTVTFKNGATVLGTGTLSGGKATFSTSTLTRGAHSITAGYSGSVSDLGSTSAVLTQTVN